VYEDTTEFKRVSYASGFLHDLWPTALELRKLFQKLLKTAKRFSCTANETLGHDVVSMCRTYVQKCKDFLSTLNGTTADDSITALYGADGLDREV
jgi:hypothetical protein